MSELTPETILRKCNAINESIAEAKAKRDRKIGESDAIMRDLRDRFGVKTREEGRKRIGNLDVQITRRNKSINDLYEAMKSKYNLEG